MEISEFIKIVKDYKQTTIINASFYKEIKSSYFSINITPPYYIISNIISNSIYSSLELREGKDIITLYFRHINPANNVSFANFKFLLCAKYYKTRKQKFLCEYNSDLELTKLVHLGKKYKMTAPSIYNPASIIKNGDSYDMVFYFKNKFMNINSDLLFLQHEYKKFDPFNFKVNEDQLRLIEMFSI